MMAAALSIPRASDKSRSEELVIRIATTADMDEIMNLAVAGSIENGFLPPSVTKLAREIWSALCQDHGLCGVIGRPGGAIEGAVLLHIVAPWNSDAKVVEERAIFIQPEFRSAVGGRARRLCEFSKKVADDMGLPLIIGVLSNHRTEGKVRLYKRIFGEPAGAFFLYGSATGCNMRQEN